MLIATTKEEALNVVRKELKTAALNKTGTVIGATKGGVWRAVAILGHEGWKWASDAQQAADIPQGQFPSVPPCALEVYLSLAGKQGGTIHGAIADVKKQGREFRERLVAGLEAVLWDDMGKEALMEAACF